MIISPIFVNILIHQVVPRILDFNSTRVSQFRMCKTLWHEGSEQLVYLCNK